MPKYDRTPRLKYEKGVSGTGPIWVLGAMALCVVVALIAGLSQRSDEHTGSVNAIDGDPAFVVPSPTVKPEPKPLNLIPDLPALSDIQMKYEHEARICWKLPIACGLDEPAIEFTDNEAAMFVVLGYTESNLNPYDEFGNHKWSHDKDGNPVAVGIYQLAGGLITPETRDNDEANIYAGAKYWRELLDEHDGDMTASLEAYKGVKTDDVRWQSQSVWAYMRVGG